MQINPVILSGGSGTRLWPMSRQQYPKQLLRLLGEQTMLQDTVKRLRGLDGVSSPLFICNEDHRFLVAEQIRELEIGQSTIFLEPVGRNTAPAATIAAIAMLSAENDAPMLIMPADHVIRDLSALHRGIREAAVLADAGRLVTFGIRPSSAETGYGYIRKGDAEAIAAFVEKPDQATAEQYLQSGDYLWNSGMFMMRPSVWLSEMKQLQPAMLASCEAAFSSGRRDADFFRLGAEAFGSCPSDSIDYAIMEKTQLGALVPLEAGWSDVGAWSSIWAIRAHDESGNVIQGDVLLHQTKNALVVSQHRLVATVGVEDVVVIETPDAVLVARKDSAQEVKAIVKQLEQQRRTEHQFHRRVYRPWGYYEGIDNGERFQVKRLQVKPGASLSLQMHHHRAEHWVVVKGTARVTRGQDEFVLAENESTYIPIGTTHRLENPGKVPLEIIEVQSGSYLGEDDIVRFEDKYNRHKG